MHLKLLAKGKAYLRSTGHGVLQVTESRSEAGKDNKRKVFRLRVVM